jgi:subtilisin family serine protease
MEKRNFPHVELIRTDSGRARMTGGGKDPESVLKNQSNRAAHSSNIKQKLANFSAQAKAAVEKRKEGNLPMISGGVPFVLQIPDENDGVIEFIGKTLKLEIVAEYDDGYLIVATEDLDLQHVVDLANDFASSAYGSGQMARILDIDGNSSSHTRISRILDEELLKDWPFAADIEMILDISIEVAAFDPPPKPRGITKKTSPDIIAAKQKLYDEEIGKFAEKWDDLRMSREDEVIALVNHYGGEILDISEDGAVEYSDSFSCRIRMRGEGFVDLIKNFPSIFEANPPDDVSQPISGGDAVNSSSYDQYELLPPVNGAPLICIIDSGIQESHRWLEPSIMKEKSTCFIPSLTTDDVADYVPAGGHGTRVAGACLYGDVIPTEGTIQAPFGLINARVLDERNELREGIFPARMLEKVVKMYAGEAGVKIFQHSIASNRAFKLGRMSTWGCAIDQLSHREDVLIIQATGNLVDRAAINAPGIIDHISAGRSYPDYLLENSSRIANPAQSLQAITVGSISHNYFQQDDICSIANVEWPSSFTRSGFGMWGGIKPEVVEYGGDKAMDSGNPPSLSLHPEICPTTIRSTLYGGPAFDRDDVGTSYAAPKVAHIAGHLQSLFPDQSPLLYRALIVNSARWPSWAESVPVGNRVKVFRTLGYGVPSLERATENSETRITLVTEQTYEASATDGYVFGIPIPEALRRQGDDFEVRIDVTLSYSAEPRRTRKSRRNYLAVWLDWMASKKREPFEVFRSRALTDFEKEDSSDINFNWVIGNKSSKSGETDGVNRKNGTVQKDWTIARSYDLPDMFGVAVHAHKGWCSDESEVARFTLVVSFEAVGAHVNVYQEIKNAVNLEIGTRAMSTVRM